MQINVHQMFYRQWPTPKIVGMIVASGITCHPSHFAIGLVSIIFVCWSNGFMQETMGMMMGIQKLLFGGPVLLPNTVLQNDVINDLTAVDASPSEKIAIGTIEPFEGHDAAAPETLHLFFTALPTIGVKTSIGISFGRSTRERDYHHKTTLCQSIK